MSKEPLKDDSPMPIGKHKGIKMEDVPASYLCWLWNNGMKSNLNCPVAKYIRDNLNVLKFEHSDGDWEPQ